MCDVCSEETEKGEIKTIDYYQEVHKIIESLQLSKPYFTKKQLCSVLKGKPAKIKIRNK